MKKENRVTYIDGLKLGYKNGADLLNLINEQIKTASNKQTKPEINLIKIAGLNGGKNYALLNNPLQENFGPNPHR